VHARWRESKGDERKGRENEEDGEVNDRKGVEYQKESMMGG
jgi:hypothetical protein